MSFPTNLLLRFGDPIAIAIPIVSRLLMRSGVLRRGLVCDIGHSYRAKRHYPIEVFSYQSITTTITITTTERVAMMHGKVGSGGTTESAEEA